MKVKVGELKTHLSKYLRALDETGQAVEVCVRDETVAYLVSADTKSSVERDAEQKLCQRLKSVNLRWDPAGCVEADKFFPNPSVAGDGRSDVATTDVMRSSSDW